MSDFSFLQLPSSLSTAARRFAAERAVRVRLAPGELWLRPGEKVDRVLALQSGVCRVFRVDAEGRETTKSFSFSGQFCAPYAELLTDVPSCSAVQALTQVEALQFPVIPFIRAAETDLEWSQFFRSVAEQTFLEKERREDEFLTLSAGERYERLLRLEPSLFQTVPLQVIASYLGITPVALSRIRRRRVRGSKPGRN